MGEHTRDLSGRESRTTTNALLIRAEWEALLAAAARHHVTWQSVTADTAPPDLERAAQRAADARDSAE